MGEAKQTATKSEMTSATIMFCIRWDWKRSIHHELLQTGQTTDANLYYLKFAIKKRIPYLFTRKGLVSQHGNSR